MKKKNLLIAASALVLVAAISVKPAMAYFTSSTTATGTVAVSIGDSALETNDTADTSAMTKTVSIKNTSSYDCYIRVKAIAGSQYSLTASGTDWTKKDDGYYYYTPIVATGATTTDLVYSIDFTEGADKSQDFNVIIVQEGTKVHYDENGKAYANWDYVNQTSQTTTTDSSTQNKAESEKTTEEDED